MKPYLLAICLAAVIAVNFSSSAKAAGPPAVEVIVVDITIPVQVRNTASTCVPSTCSVDVYTVPPGKRFVMEYMALRTQILPRDSGQSGVAVLATEFDDASFQVQVGVTTNTGSGLNSADVFAGPIKLYAQSGTLVRCAVSTPGSEDADGIFCTISGYLEDE